METLEGLKVPDPEDLHELRLEGAFNEWVVMGKGRTFKAVAIELNLQNQEVARHALKFMWRRRLGVIETDAAEITMKSMAETMADVNIIHVHEVRSLRIKMFQSLLDNPPAHSRDQIKLYELAIRLEREITGVDSQGEKKELADLLTERMKEISVTEIENKEEEEEGSTHEFELQEGLDDEPLEAEEEDGS